MAIIKQEEWKQCEEKNDNPYGKCCVDVARQVMKILDDEPEDFDTHKIICRAEEEIGEDGLTGFMVGCIAQMVSRCHSRGEEFRRKWNKDNQIKDEGDRANEKGTTLNPALLVIEDSKGGN